MAPGMNNIRQVVHDLFNSMNPTLQWRGAGDLAIGDVVAFAFDYASNAYSNPTATPVYTGGSVNHLFGNLTTMTAANTQLGFLAVARQAIKAGTNAWGEFCLEGDDVLVKCAQGTAMTGAAGQWLLGPTDLTAAFAVTAGQLFSHTNAALDGAIVPQFAYGRLHEASSGTAGAKKALWSGFGLLSTGGGG